MKNACEPFKGKKITLLGLGLLGRGVGDAEFLAKCDAHLIVTDVKTSEQLAESVARLREFSNVTLHLGGHQKEDFENADLVLKAAGVPLDSKEIALAKKNNVPVAMSTALFAKYAMEMGATIVGVTGTRGKSTTTQLIYEVLKASGKKVLLGGNVRGVSTLAMLPEVTPETICVLELDSWQLQGFGDLGISPHIAVFTNLMPDHLNYYGGDMERYFADKANIFLNQKSGDTLVVGYEVQQMISERRFYSKANMLVADMNDLLGWKLKLLGNHNLQNASCAVKVLQVLGIDDATIREGIESFTAVQGRLELVREVNGVKFYNDTTATTMDAVYAGAVGIAGIAGQKRITLIMGGTDKEIPVNEQKIEELNRIADKIILLPGTGTKRIEHLIRKRKEIVQSLNNAVTKAYEFSRPDGYVLFSPGFASFGMFKNEFDRGDQFNAIVKAL